MPILWSSVGIGLSRTTITTLISFPYEVLKTDVLAKFKIVKVNEKHATKCG